MDFNELGRTVRAFAADRTLGNDERFELRNLGAQATVEQVRFLEREATCPVETLLLPGIGHAPHLEVPDRVLPILAEFAARAFAAVNGMAR